MGSFRPMFMKWTCNTTLQAALWCKTLTCAPRMLSEDDHWNCSE